MQSFDVERAAENDSAKVNPPASVRETSDAALLPARLQRQASCACGGGCPRCQSKAAAQRNGVARASSSVDSDSSLVADALSAPGEPLQQNVRRTFEAGFGQDFSDVRVHRDERAALSAEAVSAHAYTVGREIVFGAGQYAPETSDGDRLIAHELTHVLQQSGGAAGRSANQNGDQASSLRVSHPADASEREADRVAQAVTGGVASQAARPFVHHSIDSGAVIQRQGKKEADAPAAPAPAPAAAAPAAAPAAAADAGADVLKWPDILPANSIEPLTIKKKDPARYKAMTEVCKKIQEFRQTIPVRKMKQNKYTVFDQSPAKSPSSPSPNFDDQSKEATDYRAWLKKAQTPEEQENEYRKESASDELRIQLVIWHELIGDEKSPGEGDPSAMNAYDSEGLTWGAGFSGKGPMQEMMYKHLFQRETPGGPDSDNQEVEKTFLRAGINVKKDGTTYKLVVVDVNGLWQMPQSEGVKVIKANPHLLSLFTDVAQGGDFMQTEQDKEDWKSDLGQLILKTDPQYPYKGARQAVYNAQWEQFKSRAGNVKSVVEQLKGWKSNDALAFAGHIMHWGITGLTWSDFATTGGSAAALRDLVLPRLAKGNLVKGDAAASFLRFGHAIMKSVMTASDAKVPGKINAEADGKYYTSG
jgi:hypothetical protein